MDAGQWLFLLVFLVALSKIGNHMNHRKAIKELVKATERKDEAELALKERAVAAREGKVARAELKKQIALIESQLPMKTFNRQTLRMLPPAALKMIIENSGLDPDVVQAYLKMSEPDIQRVKLGLDV
jgi:hypothetical protein